MRKGKAGGGQAPKFQVPRPGWLVEYGLHEEVPPAG